MPAPQQSCDVLILGAGMAGLTAARALAERGLRVLVLEARDRVGGRIWSETASSGDIVELGAEFLHGRAPELWAILAESGLEAAERDGVMLRESADHGLGEDSADHGLGEDNDGQDEMFAPLEQLEDFAGDDLSFAAWLRASDVPEPARPAITSYVEGFNAADAEVISARSLGVQQKAEAATEGDRSWHVRGGYAQLPEYLAGRVRELGGVIELGRVVQSIHWRPGAVEVTTSAGIVTAPRCLITLPLGVLQHVNREGGIPMTPEPAAIAHARRMAMGEATRVTLVFGSRWWERSTAAERKSLEQMSFLLTPQRLPGVWWTARTEQECAPTLTGWAGGPRSRLLAGQTAGELAAEACRALAEVFRLSPQDVREELLSAHTHDWTADPLSRGAYSYVAAGALDAPLAMTLPEAGTLYFAGEHTDTTGHWGTVHAAVRSGLRAAEQLLGEAESPEP